MLKPITVIATGYPKGEHHFYTDNRHIAQLVVPTIGRRIVLTDTWGHRFDIVRKGFLSRRYYLMEANQTLARGSPINSRKPGLEYGQRRLHLAKDLTSEGYVLVDKAGDLQLAIVRNEPLRCTITNYTNLNLALVALVYWLVIIAW